MMNEEKTKSFAVSKQMVYDSYLKVCDKNGSAGIDKETIEELFSTGSTHCINSKEARGNKTVRYSYGRRPYCTGRGKRLPGTDLRTIISCKFIWLSSGQKRT